MAKKLFVGNLSYDVDNESLKEAFEPFGEVTSAQVITDRDTGRSRGFGFVEMTSDDEAQAAIDSLDGKDLCGRNVVVNAAKERDRR
ncbi:MAG: RNA-binding protein [Chlamydiae bacterium]|nr:RNA-binding protein [Chlamydiota bacterium]